MISKLPSWVWFGGWALAFVAGMVNVVGLLGFEHLGVNHLSANTTRLGVTWVDGDWVGTCQLAALIGSFVLGATVSGAIIRDAHLRLGRRYGLALLIESALLCAATLALQSDRVIGVCLAACACGLQNAMASTYSGAIIRTTHMTGMFTDMGILLGQRLDGRTVDWRRFQLNALLVLGFLSGGMVGTLVYRALSPHGNLTLLIPAALTGFAALVYTGYRSHMRRRLQALRRLARDAAEPIA